MGLLSLSLSLLLLSSAFQDFSVFRTNRVKRRGAEEQRKRSDEEIRKEVKASGTRLCIY